MTRHRGYLLDIRYWYSRSVAVCYCSTHRYRNIGGRFSASWYKNSSACQRRLGGFPIGKLKATAATGWKKRFQYTVVHARRERESPFTWWSGSDIRHMKFDFEPLPDTRSCNTYWKGLLCRIFFSVKANSMIISLIRMLQRHIFFTQRITRDFFAVIAGEE